MQRSIEGGIELGEQGNQGARGIVAVELAHGQSADHAAGWELALRGDDAANTRNENKLQPLAVSHRIHSEGAVKIILPRPQGRALPQAAVLHLSLDCVDTLVHLLV